MTTELERTDGWLRKRVVRLEQINDELRLECSLKEARIAELERAAVAHVRQVDNMQATIDEMLASDFGKMSERIAELEGELEELKAIVTETE